VPGQPERCETQERDVRRHHAVVDDLQPGTTYAYRLVTAGAIQPPSLTNPGVVTTLTPPPGRHLFDVALVNDVHIGESCSGSLATAPVLEQSLPECFMAPEYARQMAEATGGADQRARRGRGDRQR